MTSFNRSSVYALKNNMRAINPRDAFYNDVVSGLSQSRKELPCKYFYDERGSILFTQICNTEDYYVTRTECELMEKILPELKAMIGLDATIIEFGSGEGKKIRQLLAALDRPLAYVPIDISSEILTSSAAALKVEFPAIAIYPIVADYMGKLLLPSQISAMTNRKIVYFPGSTISNFTPEEATQFFKKVSSLLRPGDGFIIGMDLIKSPNRLHRAYNDIDGITKAFNLNILQRINYELGGNFNPDFFEHYAFFNPVQQRIEMHLVSLCDHWVTVGATRFHFRHGESIHTENSYKYTLDDVTNIGADSGFKSCKVWTDPEKLFSVSFMMKL
jgi:dimethylhistidine N-methyltransferase